MRLSARDAAFALDATTPDPWSFAASLAVPLYPPLSGGPVSLRAVLVRFSAAGNALRVLASGNTNLWQHLTRATIVREISDRLRDPMIMSQTPTGLCGPFAILMDMARSSPARYVEMVRELLETGRYTCPTGRVIEAEEELRQQPKAPGPIGEVDWLLATAMRDDENIWEDVEGDANGLESMTFWGEQRGWIRDVLDLPGGGWETCFWWGETECMKKADASVKAGGVAHFLIDANLLTDGGSDTEEDMWFRYSEHTARSAPTTFPVTNQHSKDDDFPPDHWVAYLGGLQLSTDPDDSDVVDMMLWSWGRRYHVTGTVGSFAEYLYAVCTGNPP
ncbi:MAG: hypothetical protein ACXVAT_17375 [Isosphaeraceae bacterium]